VALVCGKQSKLQQNWEVNKVAVVNFQQGSRLVYNRHRSLAMIKETLFLVNIQDARGMCYTQYPCADT
jgi:hypothetical protein